MGMAASQARLLMLTARIHDVEFEAQSIQHAKLQLATQQDDVYQNYLKALDEASLTFTSINSSGEHSTLVANYNNLFSMNGAQTANGNHYVLVDSRGRIVVSEDIYEGYQNFIASGYPQNAYEFATYMTQGQNMSGDFTTNVNNILTEMLTPPIEDESLNDYYNNVIAMGWTYPQAGLNILSAQPQNDTPEYQDAMNQFLNYFYTKYNTQVFNDNSMQDYNPADFNYYVRMFNAIQQHGGCISINDFDGPVSSAANNSEWLTAMIQSGQMSVEIIKTDNHGNTSLMGTSPGFDSDLTYTSTTQVDKTALAKAEAKYEHELKLIDMKDKRFDMDLNKLETERAALTKQYDSVKKVVEDNIDRTFGIFS